MIVINEQKGQRVKMEAKVEARVVGRVVACGHACGEVGSKRGAVDLLTADVLRALFWGLRGSQYALLVGGRVQ